MRSQEEILQRIEERGKFDLFGFEVDEYISALDFEHAKPFIKEGTTEAQWNESIGENNDEALRKAMIDYLDFAVEKAVNHRGISSSRSVAHYLAWFWLLGDDEMVAFIEDEDNYPQYGAPIIAKAHERLGKELPDDERFLRMSRGESCSQGCEMGCGR
jgi:hypothetical protein